MNGWSALLGLFVQFAMLSLISIGGLTAMLPEVHRYVVEVQHWMTSAEFVRLFALAQAAPGPNMMVVTLIGWKVAGLLGALVASVAMAGPSCLLAYRVNSFWRHRRGTRWGRAVQSGVTPVAIGLLLSSGWLLSMASGEHWQLYGVTALSCAVAVATRLNPFWIVMAAGLASLIGVV